MTLVKSLLALSAVTMMAGCVNPSYYETPPITVQTSSGPVTCQLYTDTNTSWDRAIAAPSGMSIQDANAICLAEGKARAPK